MFVFTLLIVFLATATHLYLGAQNTICGRIRPMRTIRIVHFSKIFHIVCSICPNVNQGVNLVKLGVGRI